MCISCSTSMCIEKRKGDSSLTVELDVFEGSLAPLVLAEVEFSSREEAETFLPPDWFGEDVTFSGKHHNSYLSKI